MLGYVGDGRMQTSNLPVEVIAVQSVLATKNHEQRFVAGASDLAGLFPIAQPRRLRCCTYAAPQTQAENTRCQPSASAHNVFLSLHIVRLFPARRASKGGLSLACAAGLRGGLETVVVASPPRKQGRPIPASCGDRRRWDQLDRSARRGGTAPDRVSPAESDEAPVVRSVSGPRRTV